LQCQEARTHDRWFPKTHDGGPVMRQDDPNAAGIGLVAVLAGVTVIVVVLLLQAFFATAQRGETTRKALVASPAELARSRAEQRARLSSYRTMDPAKGVVAIPIERAIELVVQEAAAHP
jgi:hypothetical protein